MFTFVAVILILSAVGGFAELVFTFFRRVPVAQRTPQYLERKRIRIVRGLWTFWICIAGFVFLVSGFVGPVGVLILVPVLLTVGYSLALIDPTMLTRK